MIISFLPGDSFLRDGERPAGASGHSSRAQLSLRERDRPMERQRVMRRGSEREVVRGGKKDSD